MLFVSYLPRSVNIGKHIPCLSYLFHFVCFLFLSSFPDRISWSNEPNGCSNDTKLLGVGLWWMVVTNVSFSKLCWEASGHLWISVIFMCPVYFNESWTLGFNQSFVVMKLASVSRDNGDERLVKMWLFLRQSLG